MTNTIAIAIILATLYGIAYLHGRAVEQEASFAKWTQYYCAESNDIKCLETYHKNGGK